MTMLCLSKIKERCIRYSTLFILETLSYSIFPPVRRDASLLNTPKVPVAGCKAFWFTAKLYRRIIRVAKVKSIEKRHKPTIPERPQRPKKRQIQGYHIIEGGRNACY